ncbi:hypothetical protein D3C73_902010 [compost metagenome]
MPVSVNRVVELIRIIDEVPAVNIVDVAVVIVILAVASIILRIGPDVVRQIRVIDGQAGIDDCNNQIPAALSNIPGFRSF